MMFDRYKKHLLSVPGIAQLSAAQFCEILAEIAGLIETGKIRSTLTDTLGPVSAANVRRAHEILESGKARGKLVLEGF